MQERVISFGSIRLIRFSPFSPLFATALAIHFVALPRPATLRNEEAGRDGWMRWIGEGGGHPSFKRLQTVAKTLIAPPSRLD